MINLLAIAWQRALGMQAVSFALLEMPTVSLGRLGHPITRTLTHNYSGTLCSQEK
jgi:hypothetical protein